MHRFPTVCFLLISSLFNTVNPQHLQEGVAQDLDPQSQLEGNNVLDAPDRNPEVQNLLDDVRQRHRASCKYIVFCIKLYCV